MNENALKGMKCPKCGSLEPFAIRIESSILVYDDGTEEIHSDQIWHSDSECICHECDYVGMVKDFYCEEEQIDA